MSIRPSMCRLAIAAVCTLPSVSVQAQTIMHKVREEPVRSLASLSWTTLASDPKGDGLQARLPDAKELAYAVDPDADTVWFKVTVFEPLPEAWLGISVAIDSDDDPNNGALWWGTNKSKFDRLACAFVFRTGDEWQGYAGVGDSDSIAHGNMTNLTRDVRIAVNRADRWIALGVPRASLGPRPTVRVMATVGSMVANNDDVPNTGMVRTKGKEVTGGTKR